MFALLIHKHKNMFALFFFFNVCFFFFLFFDKKNVCFVPFTNTRTLHNDSFDLPSYNNCMISTNIISFYNSCIF